MRFMTLHRFLFVSAAAVALTSVVTANSGFTIGGRGVRVSMTPRDRGASPSPAAISDWDIRSNINQIVLHWNTTPFRHIDHDGIRSDASIAAVVTGQLGPVDVSPRRALARTDIARGKEEAAVAMGLRGNGKVKVQLKVAIDQQHAVAGKHCADVVLTLTSH